MKQNLIMHPFIFSLLFSSHPKKPFFKPNPRRFVGGPLAHACYPSRLEPRSLRCTLEKMTVYYQLDVVRGK